MGLSTGRPKGHLAGRPAGLSARLWTGPSPGQLPGRLVEWRSDRSCVASAERAAGRRSGGAGGVAAGWRSGGAVPLALKLVVLE